MIHLTLLNDITEVKYESKVWESQIKRIDKAMLDILERRNECIMSTCLIHSIARSIDILVPNLSIIYSLIPLTFHFLYTNQYKITKIVKLRIWENLFVIQNIWRYTEKITIIDTLLPIQYVLISCIFDILNEFFLLNNSSDNRCSGKCKRIRWFGKLVFTSSLPLHYERQLALRCRNFFQVVITLINHVGDRCLYELHHAYV